VILKLSLNDDSSKPFLYRKLKSDIKLEKYLKIERNFKNRQLLTKFRLSDHNIEIELGRIWKLNKQIQLPLFDKNNTMFYMI
jgi:hypothetical protein